MSGPGAGHLPSEGENGKTLLEIRNLSVSYRVGSELVHAVDDFTLKLRRGETLGLAGESACGKSTVALSILRLLPANAKVEGEILFDGRDVLRMSERELRDLRWKQISMVPQGSMNSLNPVIPVGNQIIEAISAHERAPKKETRKRVEEMLSKVSIPPSRAANFPHEFSGGMRQRVVLAMALSLRPRLVIADEPTTALDVVVQKQLLLLLRELQKEFGIAFLFVSHDLSLIGEFADRIAVMYAGKLAEVGEKSSILKKPGHPYTEALLNSIPTVFGEHETLKSIPGFPPAGTWPSGCRFHPRCEYAFDLCKEEEPRLYPSQGGSLAACHLVPKLSGKKPIQSGQE